MYAIDVEDIEDEDNKEEKRNNEKVAATGRDDLQSTSKPLVTQSIYIESNLRADSRVGIRSVRERTPIVVQSEDGAQSIFTDDEQLRAADASETDDNSKNIYYERRKPPSSSLVYNYKSSLKSENRRNEIRESIEGEEDNNLERGEQRRLVSGKRVVSFLQSTSGDYSMSRSSSGDLLIVVDGKIFRHVKEEEIEDTVSTKTLQSSLKSQTPGPQHEKSLPQYKEAVNSSSQMSNGSKRGDPGHLLIASDGSIFTERRNQTQEPLGHPIGQTLRQPASKTQTIRYEDWSHDVEQVEFSKTSKSQEAVEYIPKSSGVNVRSKCPSSERNDSQKPSHTQIQKFDKHRSSKRKESKEIRAGEKSQLDLDAECRDAKSRAHRTASSICDCKESYKDGCESVHKCSSIKLKSDDCKCDDSFERWCLGVDKSESQETASYVDGSGRKSKAGRNLFLNDFSGRKGCECDCEQRDKHNVSVSEHCNGFRPFGSIPRSSALAGKKCRHSLSRGSSCCSNDTQSSCSAGFPHSKPSHDRLDIILCSSPEVESCKELILKELKASAASGRRGDRPIPPACSQPYHPDVELPTQADESTIARSLLVDKNNHPNLAMIGEIAAQLESRIVEYVFAGLDRKSSYGILVRNIPEVIETYCVDRQTRRVNVPLQFRLVKRFAYIRTSLKPFGYNFDFHPQFSIDMVNKYGRPNLSDAQRKFELSPIDLEVRKEFSSFIQTNCSPNETEHVTILLDCLMLLASDDGKSLFLWQQK